MLGGADLMVNCAVGLAARLGMAQGFAGLTLVGVGTSAPLIASSVQGARRGEHELVVGNVLGGNLFIALGGGALVGLLVARSARRCRRAVAVRHGRRRRGVLAGHGKRKRRKPLGGPRAPGRCTSRCCRLSTVDEMQALVKGCPGSLSQVSPRPLNHDQLGPGDSAGPRVPLGVP